jgi:hypothetical protein
MTATGRVLLGISATLLALAPPAWAESEDSPAREEAMAPVVRASRTSLVLDWNRSPSQVELSPETSIFVGDREASLAELKPGTEVRVVYRLDAGHARADWIEILPGGGTSF